MLPSGEAKAQPSQVREVEGEGGCLKMSCVCGHAESGQQIKGGGHAQAGDFDSKGPHLMFLPEFPRPFPPIILGDDSGV